MRLLNKFKQFKNSGVQMNKADYSIASPEERENVIQILQRNTNHIIEQKKTNDADKLREAVAKLCERVRKGDVITGADFQKLVFLFQKKSIV